MEIEETAQKTDSVIVISLLFTSAKELENYIAANMEALELKKEKKKMKTFTILLMTLVCVSAFALYLNSTL